MCNYMTTELGSNGLPVIFFMQSDSKKLSTRLNYILKYFVLIITH